jgi:hypothetical protein
MLRTLKYIVIGACWIVMILCILCSIKYSNDWRFITGACILGFGCILTANRIHENL